jgi:hypothetical protein
VADRGVVAQIVGYMAEVAAAPPSKRGQSGVRGIVIAGRSDAVLQGQVQALAQAEGFEVEWITYRVEMVLEPTLGSDWPRRRPPRESGVTRRAYLVKGGMKVTDEEREVDGDGVYYEDDPEPVTAADLLDPGAGPPVEDELTEAELAAEAAAEEFDL